MGRILFFRIYLVSHRQSRPWLKADQHTDSHSTEESGMGHEADGGRDTCLKAELPHLEEESGKNLLVLRTR